MIPRSRIRENSEPSARRPNSHEFGYIRFPSLAAHGRTQRDVARVPEESVGGALFDHFVGEREQISEMFTPSALAVLS